MDGTHNFIPPYLRALPDQELRALLPNEQFNEALDTVSGSVVQTVRRTHPRAWPPLLFALGRRGEDVGLLVQDVGSFSSDKEKYASFEAAGEDIVRSAGITPVVVFSAIEAWTVLVDPAELAPGQVIVPSVHPARQEVLTVDGMTLDRRTNAVRFAIERSASGTMASLAVQERYPYGDGQQFAASGLLFAVWRGVASAIEARRRHA